MKLKYWIVLFAFGYVIGTLGAWMKILHMPSADLFLTLSMILKSVTVLFIAYKLIGNQELKDLMNK
jgi:hypothetical protein